MSNFPPALILSLKSLCWPIFENLVRLVEIWDPVSATLINSLECKKAYKTKLQDLYSILKVVMIVLRSGRRKLS